MKQVRFSSWFEENRRLPIVTLENVKRRCIYLNARLNFEFAIHPRPGETKFSRSSENEFELRISGKDFHRANRITNYRARVSAIAWMPVSSFLLIFPRISFVGLRPPPTLPREIYGLTRCPAISLSKVEYFARVCVCVYVSWGRYSTCFDIMFVNFIHRGAILDRDTRIFQSPRLCESLTNSEN